MQHGRDPLETLSDEASKLTSSTIFYKAPSGAFSLYTSCYTSRPSHFSTSSNICCQKPSNILPVPTNSLYETYQFLCQFFVPQNLSNIPSKASLQACFQALFHLDFLQFLLQNTYQKQSTSYHLCHMACQGLGNIFLGHSEGLEGSW